ncbi:hypothetical protein C8R45DRAFT_1205530 [Mycena sanguinolenta]|nr:hypothetical protein C8R45DRAFT_1205530 [Mycena sanguinolenta]
MSSVDNGLRKRLAAVDASIHGLQYERWTILRELKTLTGSAPISILTCPILTNMSREIMSQIFLHCLPLFSTLHTRYGLLQLLQVCRAWRSIALATPGLWANLTFNLGSLSEDFLKGGELHRFIDDCASRAGTCPFSLVLRGNYYRAQGKKGLVPGILERLAPRIQVLELSISMDEYPQHTLDLPLLQKLTLNAHYCTSSSSDPTSFPIPAFGVHHNFEKLNVAVFYGESLSSRECVNILRSAPSLVECSLIEPEPEGDIPIVSHPGLKTLNLVDDALTEFVRLPGLQHLGISTFDTGLNPRLLPFISASSTSLVTLTSPRVPLDSLSDMVALTDLKLRDPPSDHVVQLVALLDRTKHQNILPKLQALELDSCSPYVNAVLVEALSSRAVASQTGGAMLRSFRYIWPPKTPGDAFRGYFQEQEFAAVCEELVRKGLKIYIGHREPGECLFNHQDFDFDSSRHALGGIWESYPI